jgi:hypothetical protein
VYATAVSGVTAASKTRESKAHIDDRLNLKEFRPRRGERRALLNEAIRLNTLISPRGVDLPASEPEAIGKYKRLDLPVNIRFIKFLKIEEFATGVTGAR